MLQNTAIEENYDIEVNRRAQLSDTRFKEKLPQYDELNELDSLPYLEILVT